MFCLQTPPPPPPDAGDGVNRSTVSFFRTWSYCITNKRNHKISCIPPPPPPDPGVRVKRSKFHFQNMVRLHIKLNGIRKCTRYILLADPLTLGVKRSEFTFFQNMVMLHIQIKENHEYSNIAASILLAHSTS